MVLVVAAIFNLVFYVVVGPSSLLQQPNGTVVALAGGLLLLVLAAYQASVIARALAVRLYRNQALGIGLVAVANFVLVAGQTIIVALQPPNGGGAYGTTANWPLIFFTWIVLFYWIDASVRASRRSDPLLRDTLLWSRVRLAVWAVMLGSMAAILIISAYLVATTGLSLVAQVTSPYVQPGSRGILTFLAFFPPIIFGAIYLPIAAYRSRDPTLRRHLSWFGMFILLYLGVLLSFSLPFKSFADLGGSEVLLVAGYFLYRSARSLAPLNRFTLEAEESHA